METVTVQFPINEAVEMIRLLRAESRCLLENGGVTPDYDVVQRAQHVLSARERIVTELEMIAGIEDVPQPIYGLTMTDRKVQDAFGADSADLAVTNATTLREDVLVTPTATDTFSPTLREDIGDKLTTDWRSPSDWDRTDRILAEGEKEAELLEEHLDTYWPDHGNLVLGDPALKQHHEATDNHQTGTLRVSSK